MFTTPPNDLMPVVVYALEQIDGGDCAKQIEIDAVGTPGKIRLIDSITQQPILVEGVLLTRRADHEVGVNLGSLFAVIECDQPFPLFRRTPEGKFEPDESTLVTDVQWTQWSNRK